MKIKNNIKKLMKEKILQIMREKMKMKKNLDVLKVMKIKNDIKKLMKEKIL